jgi:hypothetical protein
MFQTHAGKFEPGACEFWQRGRIPRSPLRSPTNFLRWQGTDSEENYRQHGNKEFSVESVGYQFNSLGYRGPEFQLEPRERTVLFLGDSHTMGTGMPWTGLWTTLVTTHLNRRWGVPVRQLNLAWGGTSPDYVAMMVHQCVEVLSPDVVFVLWSYVTRMMWFPDTRRPVHFNAANPPKDNPKEHEAYLRLFTDPQGFFNYVRNFQLVNEHLLRLGIPYFWGNLESFSSEMLRPYVPLEGYVGHWKRVDLARDARHGGLKTHAAFAEQVIRATERSRLGPKERVNA